MKNDFFDKIIKQKADGHEAPVPPDAWDNITKEKKKRRYIIFWWSLSSLLIISGLFVYINLAKTNHNSLATNQNKQPGISAIQSNNNSGKNVKINSNTNSKETNDSITNINIQQKNEISNTEIAAPNSTMPGQANKQNETQAGRGSYVKSRQPNTVNDKQYVLANTTNNKRYLHTKGKFKSTITNLSVDSATVDKPVINTNDNNNNIAQNINNNKVTKSILSKPNDSTKILIAGLQKPPKSDSAIKAKEKDTGNTIAKNQTKKPINAVKKTKQPAFVLDFSVTPFEPIQHYAQPNYVTRVSVNNGVQTVYSANSIKSSLQSSVAFGIDIKKNITSKLMIGTGIHYAAISENISLSGIETDTVLNTIQILQTTNIARSLVNDTVASVTSGTRVINAVNSCHIWSIPLFLNYTFFKHKMFALSVSGGVYFNIAQYNNSIEGKLQSVYNYGMQVVNAKNNISTDAFGGLRLFWLVSKKYQLFAEPNFRYNLNKYELENTFINKNIDQAGVSVGVSYKFY